MRILLGPMKAENESGIRDAACRLDDSFCFYDQESGSYAEIASKFPEGWEPDVVIHWSLEYYSPPEGIENAGCLTAAVLGDWNMGGQAMHLMGGAFDYLIADKKGCDRLREAGFVNVLHASLWSYDPAMHKIIPGIERDIDILMIGNFNHEIQRERARWISRVLQLSNRYNVCITAGFFGEEYTKMMNRAKIVFNRSIRGEMNMRAYESAACGALLFYERENSEVGDFFIDGKDCVLYGEDNLEELLEYYLSHPEEAEKIALSGHTAVTPFTMPHHTNYIYNLLESELNKGEYNPSSRPILQLSPADREYNRLCHQLLMPVHHPYKIAEQLALLEGRTSDAASLYNARGCALSGLANQDIEEQFRQIFIEQAAACFQNCIVLQPDSVVAWFNLSQLAIKTNLPNAQYALEKTCLLLNQPQVNPHQLIGPYFPGMWDALRMELERVFGSYIPESVEWCGEMKTLLLWLVNEQLSDNFAVREEWETAYDYAQKAVELRPEVFSTRLKLGRALKNLGYLEKAADEFRLSLKDLPLNPEVWQELAETLLAQNLYSECHTLLSECRTALIGCPVYNWWQSELERLEADLASCRSAQPKQLTLIAFPEWETPADWQEMIKIYVNSFHPADPIMLVLTAPENSTRTVVEQLTAFITQELHNEMSEIPNITLTNQPYTEAECVNLLYDSDIAVHLPSGKVKFPHHLPVLTVDMLPHAFSIFLKKSA